MDFNDFNTILGVVSLAVTIILGVGGIRYTLKQNTETSLTFLVLESISLFEGLVKNIKNLEIKYKSKVINENIIFFKGAVLNTGTKDINKNQLFEDFEILLPPDYIILEFGILKNTPNTNVTIKNNSTSLNFRWDLLKKG